MTVGEREGERWWMHLLSLLKIETERGEAAIVTRESIFVVVASICRCSINHATSARQVSIMKRDDRAVCIDEWDEECRVTRKAWVITRAVVLSDKGIIEISHASDAGPSERKRLKVHAARECNIDRMIVKFMWSTVIQERVQTHKQTEGENKRVLNCHLPWYDWKIFS